MKVTTLRALGVATAVAMGSGLAGQTDLAGQAAANVTLESQQRGAAALARAIAAGGVDALMDGASLELRLRFTPYSVGQGTHPGAPSTPTTNPAGLFTFEQDLHMGYRVYRQFAADTSTQPNIRLVMGSGEPFAVNFGTNTAQPVDLTALGAILSAFPSVTSALTEAWANLESVRWIGEDSDEGARVDVVSFVGSDGRQVALHIDGATGDVLRSVYLDSHPQYGDHAVTANYRDYRSVHGLRVPYEVEVRTAGVTLATARVESASLGKGIDASALEIPQDMEWSEARLGGATAGTGLEVSDLGNGAYLIPGASAGYNVMFVDLGESVLVLEAPVNAQVAEVVMEKIDSTLPGKPIEFVAMTHYHFDHSGGLAPYLESRATVVASKGNQEFVNELARAPRTLAGQVGPIDEPQFEAVNGHRKYGDAHRVELYEVGPNPHVDEILVAYLPESKLLFVADLYSYNGQVTPAPAMTLAFADRLEELELDIETIVPVHGQQVSAADFWESVRLGREK